MQSADLVAVVFAVQQFSGSISIITDDRAKLQSVLSAYSSGEGQGFDNGTTGTSEGAAETGGALSPRTTRTTNTFSAGSKNILALQSLMR